MPITWQKRHESDPSLLAYEGRFIRGQVAVYGPADAPFWIGYLSGMPVTERCVDANAACRRVEEALGSAM